MPIFPALLALFALTGCHLIDDFGRFHQLPDGGLDPVLPDDDGSVETIAEPAPAADAGKGAELASDAASGDKRDPALPAVDAGRALNPRPPGGRDAALPGVRDATAPRAPDAAGPGVPDTGTSGPGPRPDPDAGCDVHGQPRALRVLAQAVVLGRLELPPSVESRVLGPSIALAPGSARSGRLWFVSSNLTTSDMGSASRPSNQPSLARDGVVTPWTAPQPAGPWRLDEALNDAGAVMPALRLFPDEQDMNVSLYVTAALEGSAASADVLAFVQRSPGFFQPVDSVWSARFVAGAAPGMRDMKPLFTAPEPMFGIAAYHGDGYVKLLACAASAPSDGSDPAGDPNGDAPGPSMTTHPCVVARAPAAESTQRAAYEFYTRDGRGGSWTPDVSLATPVVDGNDAQLSLSWNPYLSKFLLVHSVAFGNSVVLQTALQVEGPWSERVEVALPAPVEWVNMFAREHASAAQQCGKRIILTHWSPTASNGQLPTDGDVVLSAIDLE